MIVSLEETNIAEVAGGRLRGVVDQPERGRTSIGVTVEADGVTWIRGSVIALPQGAGETLPGDRPGGHPDLGGTLRDR